MKRASPLKRIPLERRTPLPRGIRKGHNSTLAPGGPLRAKGGARFKGRRDDPYRAYIRGLPCLIGVLCLGPVEAHHVRTRGAGGADRANLIPLCGRHHAEWHTIGRQSFQRRWGLDAVAEAAELAAQFVGCRPTPARGRDQ